MKTIATADIVIFGGGIAGLWLLNRLRKETDLSVILLEAHALGGVQTFKSQGIIHGGMKYALQGAITNEAKAMADMPDVWKACLQGKGELDLSKVNVLSDHHYLWSPNKLTAKLTGFLASTTLNSKVSPLDKNEYPEVFQHPNFKGDVYSLDEMVLDIPALVRELVKVNQDVIYKIEPLSEDDLHFDEDGKLISTTVHLAGKSIQVSAQEFIFTAGAGNEVLVHKLKNKDLSMQRRPLHMVLVKLNSQHALYAHCLGIGTKPRLTITTHYTQDNEPVWYLGGAIAEEGVKRSKEEQIEVAKRELKNLFPWLDFSNAEYATFFIDRAEPKEVGGQKPLNAYWHALQNMIIGWPTKLALAPQLVENIITHLKKVDLQPQLRDTRELRSWPMPPLATPIWESAFCKNAS